MMGSFTVWNLWCWTKLWTWWWTRGLPRVWESSRNSLLSASTHPSTLEGSQPLLDYHPCARVQIRHQMVFMGAFMTSASTTSCRISRIYHSSHWESFLAANPVTSASTGFADPWRKRVWFVNVTQAGWALCVTRKLEIHVLTTSVCMVSARRPALLTPASAWRATRACTATRRTIPQTPAGLWNAATGSVRSRSMGSPTVNVTPATAESFVTERTSAKETPFEKWSVSSTATHRVPPPPKCRAWSAAAAAAAAGSAASPSAASGGNTSSSAWMAPPSRKNWRDTWNAAAQSAYKPFSSLLPL